MVVSFLTVFTSLLTIHPNVLGFELLPAAFRKQTNKQMKGTPFVTPTT